MRGRGWRRRQNRKMTTRWRFSSAGTAAPGCPRPQVTNSATSPCPASSGAAHARAVAKMALVRGHRLEADRVANALQRAVLAPTSEARLERARIAVGFKLSKRRPRGEAVQDTGDDESIVGARSTALGSR